MEKTIFKNKLFYYLLISYLIVIICWNSYSLITGNLSSVISVLIQLFLIILIFKKNKHAKIGIKIWSVIIILSSGISFLAKLLKIFLGDEIIIADILSKMIVLSIGLLIYVFNEKHVEIREIID